MCVGPVTSPPYMKSFTIVPALLQDGLDVLHNLKLQPRGFMYWCIADDADHGYYLSRGLKALQYEREKGQEEGVQITDMAVPHDSL